MADEPEQSPYYLAARFSDEGEAEGTYFRMQNYIERHSAQLELSVYRFLLPGRSGESIVTVLGVHPGEDVDKRLRRALSAGELIDLNQQTLGFLHERREAAKQQGPWVERHYRPGHGFHLDM